MALTLDATLAAAQDAQSRRPIVEIISAQRTADIPFDGSMLTSETFNEYGINMIPHSSGRLVLAYIYYNPTGSVSGIKFVYTDTGRTEFTTVDLPLYSYGVNEIKAVSICEMTGGNIGMVLLVDDKANHLYRLTRRIYTVAGAAVSNAEIANWSHDIYTSDPWVQTLGANSYLIVYGKYEDNDPDPDHYHLYKRTSANFTTWAAENELSIAGVDDTYRKANPSIVKISTGDLWLWFDALESTGPGGEELTNVYYSVSADGGGTWGAAVKVTAYTGYGEVGSHPVAVQKAANQMYLIFTRKVGALHLDDTATGWPTGDCSTELSWDSVNRKLYAVNCWNSPANKYLQCVVKIDVDTWTVDGYWDETTSPGFPSFLTDESHNVWFNNKCHDGHLIGIACIDSAHRFLYVLDGEANTITGYYMDTDAGHSIAANVSNAPGWGVGERYGTIQHVFVDAANEKVWLVFLETYVWNPGVVIGYIDLAEASDYEFHTVVTRRNVDDSGISDTAISGATHTGDGGFWVDVDAGLLILTSGWKSGTFAESFLWVFDIATGGELYFWDQTDTDWPIHGALKPTYYNGCVYAGMANYTSGSGQSAFRGLIEVNLAAETVTLHRPAYCTEDDHDFGRPYHLADGRLAMTHRGYGIAIFDTVAKSWQLFGNVNVAGLTQLGTDYFSNAQIQYDATNEMIFVGDPGSLAESAASGVLAFSINGYIRQAYYGIGTNPGAGWSFAAATQLIQGVRDYDAAAAVEPGSSTSMFVFWTSESVEAEKSIKWDKDGSSKDLSAYIVAGAEVAAERGIDGKPASLSFTVSHGHLFDPYNAASLYNLYLKKGRKLTLRWGEKVSGTDYWANAGTFFVTGTSLSFRRGEYPVMEVEAEDMRALWANAHILATDAYNNLPEDIIEDLLLDVANLPAGDINLPAFIGGSMLQMQWIDTTLDEIVTQVCNRFGYFFRFDTDGKAHARRITNAAGIDHAYTANSDLIAYTPDDKYSDFTNRVTVQGQEMDFTTVTFAEERIAALSGTLGWWGCKKDHVVWFSDDKSRRCVNPRLGVLETATSIPFQLQGSVSERLEECGAADDNKFCTVYAEAPDLTAQLASAIGLIATGLGLGDYSFPAGGMTIPVGKIIEKAGLIWAIMILGSTANYQYEVWAQPLGSVRRSVQATWNDEEHQVEIGSIVPQVITDPLCYSAADCLAVATFEGMVVRMQRKRVSLTKVAHLQDEEGDTIRRVHPYSGQTIDLFVARLRRVLTLPAPGEDGGAFVDEIEGWVVS